LYTGIRGEDAGTLVCYVIGDDSEDEQQDETNRARLELKVLGTFQAFS